MAITVVENAASRLLVSDKVEKITSATGCLLCY